MTRAADRDLYDGLNAGEFCYVLTARQMGKSSLMVRTAARLRDDGAAVVVLDLTAIGQNLTVEQWYEGLLERIGRQLELEDELDEFWLNHSRMGPFQRWMAAIHDVVIPKAASNARAAHSDAHRLSAASAADHSARVVVFIDEIDAVRNLPFSTDEFFAGIRECYNRRSEDPTLAGLTFCLLGVAAPTDLVRDVRTTPFNIGRRVELADFTEEDALPLAQGFTVALDTSGQELKTDSVSTHPSVLSAAAAPAGDLAPHESRDRISFLARILLRRVLYWTGGHPYLTQRLCRSIAESLQGSPDHAASPPAGTSMRWNPSAQVDRLCEAMFLSHNAREQDDNLLFVRDRILRTEEDRASLLELYAAVRRGRRVLIDERNPDVTTLRLAGIVRSVDGRMKVRNRIYACVFDAAWIQSVMPGADLRRQRSAFQRGLFRATGVSLIVLAVTGFLLGTAIHEAKRAKDSLKKAESYERQLNRSIRYAQKQTEQATILAQLRTRALDELEKADEQMKKALAEAQQQRDLAGTASIAARDAQQSEHRQRLVAEYAEHAMQVALAASSRSAAAAVLSVSRERKALAEVQLEKQQITHLWTRGETEQGVHLLEEDNNLGLLNLAQAGKTAQGAESRTLGRLWAGWYETSSGRLSQILGHGSVVSCIGFNPVGDRIATGGFDGAVRIWNTATGQLVGKPLVRPGRVLGLAFSPDGKTLAVGMGYGSVHLWDPVTGLEEAPPLPGKGRIHLLRYSPDGKTLAVAYEDGTAQMWKVQRVIPPKPRDASFSVTLDTDLPKHNRGHGVPITDGEPITLSAFPYGQPLALPGPMADITFSSDGRMLMSLGRQGIRLWYVDSLEPFTLPRPMIRPTTAVFNPKSTVLAVGCDDGSVHMTDVVSGEPSPMTIQHGSFVRALAFAPNGRYLAVGGADTVRLWDVSTGETVGDVIPIEGRVASLAFSPDGRILATGSQDGSLRLLDPSSGQLLGQPIRHEGRRFRILFSPESQCLATASEDGSVRLWDTAPPQARDRTLRCGASVKQVAFSPGGGLAATVTTSGEVVLWNAAGGEAVGRSLRSDRTAERVIFGPDGRLLAVCSRNSVEFWSAGSGSLTGKPVHLGPELIVTLFSPDGRRFAVVTIDGALHVWDLSTGQFIGVPIVHVDADVLPAFSKDGRSIAVVFDDGSAQIYDVASGQPKSSRLLQRVPIRGLSFSSNRRWLLTYGGDSACLWNASNGAPHGGPLIHRSAVDDAIFSPDGGILATRSLGIVRLWVTSTATSQGNPLLNGSRVSILRFSPDGRILATASDDLSARLWSTQTGQLLCPPLDHADTILDIAFTPDSSIFLTSAADHSVRMWETATFQPCGAPLIQQGAIRELAVSPDGKRIVTASGSVAQLWRIPQPPADIHVMELLTWTALAARLNDYGIPESIPPNEWLALRASLAKVDRGL